MGVTVFHSLSATTPDDPSYEIRPSHWNSSHVVSVDPFIVSAGTNSTQAPASVVFSNANGVTFGMDANGVITATVTPGAAAGIAAIQAGTNTATSGTVNFSNANGLTFGMNPTGVVTGSYTVPAAGLSAINVSAGTTSQNLTALTFSNSNGLAFGLNGSVVTGSYTTPTQSVQTQASGAIAGSGFTSTSTAGVVVAGTNDSNGLKLAVPAYITTYAAQTNQTVASGNIAGTGFSSTTTAGTAVVGTLNTAGLSLGVPQFLTTSSQSVQTQASGAIAGTGFTSTTTAGTAIVGTNNTAGLSIGVPAYITTYVGQTTQTQPAGNIAGVGTTFAGTNVSGSMTLNSNGLNLALSAAAAGGGGFTGGVSTGGNTVGNTGTQTGSLVFVGGNNITLSVGTAAGGAQTITISGANAGGAQTGISGISAGTQIQTAGTMQLVNSNGISFGMSNSSQITASYTVPTQSTQPVAVSGSNGSFTFSTLTLGALNGMTFYTSNGSVVGSYTVPTVPTSYVSQVNGSSGAVSMAVGSSLSSSTNGSSITWGLASNITTALQSAGAYLTTAAQSSASNVSLINAATNNTGGGTASLSGAISFSNANNMTFYTSAGNAIVGSFSTSQSVQTQASGNIAGAGFTTTTTAGSVMVGTHNSAGLSLGVPNWLTVAAGGAFSAGASTDALGTTGLVNAQLVFFEGANVSLSQSVNGQSASLSISAAAGGGGVTGSWWQPEVWGSMGSTSLANGTVYLRAFELDAAYDCDMLIFQQSISSQASSTLSFSASVSAGNASSGSGSLGQTMTALWFSRVNTNETNASYNSIVSFDSKTYSLGQGYSASVSWSTNVSSATATLTTSWAVSYIKNIDGVGGITTGSTGTSGSTTFSSTSTNANSFSSSYALSAPYAHVSGIRPIFFPQAGSNVPGGEYWLGLIQSTNTGSTNMSLQRPLSYATQAIVAFTGSTQNSYLEYGNSANLSTSNYRPGFGSYSASTNTTAAIPLSAVSILGSNASIWFAVAGKTL